MDVDTHLFPEFLYHLRRPGHWATDVVSRTLFRSRALLANGANRPAVNALNMGSLFVISLPLSRVGASASTPDLVSRASAPRDFARFSRVVISVPETDSLQTGIWVLF